eukprot:365406-Chlamydomonas_euryale.AAC.4
MQHAAGAGSSMPCSMFKMCSNTPSSASLLQLHAAQCAAIQHPQHAAWYAAIKQASHVAVYAAAQHFQHAAGCAATQHKMHLHCMLLRITPINLHGVLRLLSTLCMQRRIQSFAASKH